ncbi:hypothetical protein evm_002310 [Chilo suppressalis]|nr:hypothetical protein evm_002310 [Chilo suppressalis]
MRISGADIRECECEYLVFVEGERKHKLVQKEENDVDKESAENENDHEMRDDETRDATEEIQEMNSRKGHALLLDAPNSYEVAVKSEDWKKAVDKELNALEKLETWEESNLPEGKQAIDTKWIFKIKDDGTKKARLVVRGFQKKKEDYFDRIYSPVARQSSVMLSVMLKMFLSKAVREDKRIRQLDIPTAFLNGKVKSEVYIKVPPKTSVPNLGLLITERIYNQDKRSKEQALCWYKEYLFGLLINLTVVQMLKILVGEPRPHFFDTCKPKEASTCTGSEYVSSYTCTKGHWMNYPDTSFPSGHASLGIHTGFFIAYYLHQRTKLNRSSVILPLQIICVVTAVFCGISRITDKRHHWWDVLAGAVIGGTILVYTIFSLCRNFNCAMAVSVENAKQSETSLLADQNQHSSVKNVNN